jgi:hypothetical protein
MSSVVDPSINPNLDQSNQIKEFFDRNLSDKISLSSNQVDSVVGFFKKRGFDENAAISVASVILQQAKKDNTNIFKIIDTLQGLDNVQLSSLVATILNNNRSKISNIGFVSATSSVRDERNIRV